MMICDADFDELFPWMARAKRPAPVKQRPVQPDATLPDCAGVGPVVSQPSLLAAWPQSAPASVQGGASL